MQNSKLLNLSISEISKLLDQKKISSLELAKEVFKHIKKVEPKVKAFITLTEKEALIQAKESDVRRQKSEVRSKIDGIPISIKDVICTKDIKTTAGSRMLEDFVPAYDATVVERLKNAGAVIIGKNNCDAWAHGASTENSDFFPTHNPWDLERVPGGSSGGSAAAVASRMGFASIGTDTGGSIRQPAGFCGVTGLKVTYGRNSRYGLISMASSLDTPGVLAKSAEDAAIIQEIIGGADPKDSTTVSRKEFSTQTLQVTSYKLHDIKIGIPKEYFAKGLDPKVEKSVMEAVKVLEKAGAKVKKISLPHTEYAVAAYYIIMPAEVSSNLARYDGIKYGFSIEKDLRPSGLDLSKIPSPKNKEQRTIHDIYNYSRSEGFGDEAKRRIMLGTYVLSAGYFDAYYKKAMKVRTLIRADFEKAFHEVDVIITPMSPKTAFKIGEKSSDPLQMYMEDIYSCPANIAGIPGVSIPVRPIELGLRSSGLDLSKKQNTKNKELSTKLPIGMQILGPQFGEEIILQVANYYQKITNYHELSPKI